MRVRPLGAGLQEEASNYLSLLRSKAVVVSRAGQRARKYIGSGDSQEEKRR